MMHGTPPPPPFWFPSDKVKCVFHADCWLQRVFPPVITVLLVQMDNCLKDWLVSKKWWIEKQMAEKNPLSRRGLWLLAGGQTSGVADLNNATKVWPVSVERCLPSRSSFCLLWHYSCKVLSLQLQCSQSELLLSWCVSKYKLAALYFTSSFSRLLQTITGDDFLRAYGGISWII